MLPSLRRLAAPVLLAALGGCSLHQVAVNRMASALASSADVYEADDDPEFVRLAAPSTLKDNSGPLERKVRPARRLRHQES